ncbi:MAG: cupin domain-containing protein [Chloroflexi bacterium]|nr:cupin domain-containing protein [Chloroflexota bacterium]
MQREAERRREPEPVHFNRNIEETQQRTAADAEKVASLPRVLKASDTPWSTGVMGFSRHWIGNAPRDRLARAPICTMSILEQILDPGIKGGRHRHVREAIFYIIEGEGYEVHDGKRYDWQAGDIMTVPSYCDHQHFNPNPTRRARMWYSVSPMVEFMGIHWVEQIEMRSGYRIPEDARPVYGPDKQVTGTTGILPVANLAGYITRDGREFKIGFNQAIQNRINCRLENVMHIDKPRDTYEEYVKLLEDEVTWRQSVPHVVRGAPVPFENTRMGRIKFLVTPKSDCGLKTYDAFLQELPPGGRSGKHRHVTEEVHKILQGRGYDVHDGVRHDWEAEDVVCIPPYAEHQHFNADPDHRASFVSLQSRWYAFMGHGGIEHLEDAPSGG